MPGVITNSESPTAADHDRITATRETLEDYTLRLAPRSYRRWPPAVVGISARRHRLPGGLRDRRQCRYHVGYRERAVRNRNLRTGGLRHRLAAGLLRGAVQHRPDLITRGSGFGYYGSVVTNVIFATFTFIFFALEGSIMAQGLKLGLHIPLWAGYACSTLIIFPLVVYG